MILQALQRYYERLKDDGTSDLEMEGFKRVPIPFVIIISPDGRLVSIDDTRDPKGNARPFIVPKVYEGSRTVNIKANLLWDKASYVFGVSRKANVDRLKKQKEKFRETILDYFPERETSKGVDTVLRFLDHYCTDIHSLPAWKEISESDPNITFRLENKTGIITDSEEVREAIERKGRVSEERVCLISGKLQPVARLENPIRGLRGSGKAESHFVAFNEPAYWSYGKRDKARFANAPISNTASFEYVAAINYLQRVRPLVVGDATTVFWTEQKHEIENVFAQLFGEPARGEPEQDYKAILALFRAPLFGDKPNLDPDTFFHVLGLSPNAARIAVRFWYTGRVREVIENISRHFEDLEIAKRSGEWRTISLRSLLRATAQLEKDENIQPNLAGDTMKAILTGAAYPATLLSGAVRRCRAEQSKKDPHTGRPLENIPYNRAALIKAVLVRDSRFGKRFTVNSGKEIGMSLDLENTNVGYRLGRLFAILEKIQEEASPGINATIRDRFYGSASATPVAAFPHLMKLKNHHLSKLENRGRAVNLEKAIGEIIDGVQDFPAHLSLADQGRFAVGYYHQRQAFFAK